MNREVNERQRQILTWVAEGCPDRSWPDETHKHSARALQNRGLVKVSRVDGVWTACLTEAGRHFVEHDTYPPGEPAAPPRRPRRRPAVSVSSSRKEVAAAPTLQVEPVPLGPPAPTPAEWLYLRLLGSDGRLQIETATEGSAVKELEKSGLAPAGKVIKSSRRGWHHQVLYFDDDPKVAVPRRTIVVPQRLSKPHPLAKRYQQERDLHEVSRDHLARATRIVHALAVAFDEAELPMDLRPGKADGQFHVRSGRWGETIKLSEKSAPGGDPIPHFYSRRGQRLPAWEARRQKQFISTGKLTVVVGGPYYGQGRQYRFSDGRNQSLEDVLPDVVREVEMRLFERGQQDREAEREEQEQQARWEVVLDAAEERAVEAFRVETLAARAQRWRAWQDERAYIDGLRASNLGEDLREDGVSEWIAWSEARLAATDPLKADHGMPTPPPPTRNFVEPHLRGWAGQLRAFRA